MGIETTAGRLLAKGRVSIDTITAKKDEPLSYWFKVKGFSEEEHTVRLWDEVKGGNVIHRWSCTCLRGSLINPTHHTDCSHVFASRMFLALPYLEAEKRKVTNAGTQEKTKPQG